MIDLTAKTALVTGGAVGIGHAIALALADCGARVAITYLSHLPTGGAEEAQRPTWMGVAEKLDATQSAEVDRVVNLVAHTFDGHIDILVNNAGGLVDRKELCDITDEFWHAVIDRNLSSAVYCARAVLPHMQSGWGRIINIGSIAAHNGGGPGAMAYAAAKGGLHSLTRAMARELAPRGITVNAVAPGFVADTPFHATFSTEEMQQAAITRTALHRAGKPSDVAGAVTFLASDLAAFVTGEIIEVNGGQWFA
jgi:3-oxoacyl-[acyl-carrier protein] reductase